MPVVCADPFSMNKRHSNTINDMTWDLIIGYKTTNDSVFVVLTDPKRKEICITVLSSALKATFFLQLLWIPVRA